MLQHLLRRLVFDVPILNEYAKMPLKVKRLLSFITTMMIHKIHYFRSVLCAVRYDCVSLITADHSELVPGLQVQGLVVKHVAYVMFQLLTNHYERCWKYYCLPNGWANFGVTSEEELHLSRKLFWGIFESLAHKVGDESAFTRAVSHRISNTAPLIWI